MFNVISDSSKNDFVWFVLFNIVNKFVKEIFSVPIHNFLMTGSMFKFFIELMWNEINRIINQIKIEIDIVFTISDNYYCFYNL